MSNFKSLLGISKDIFLEHIFESVVYLSSSVSFPKDLKFYLTNRFFEQFYTRFGKRLPIEVKDRLNAEDMIQSFPSSHCSRRIKKSLKVFGIENYSQEFWSFASSIERELEIPIASDLQISPKGEQSLIKLQKNTILVVLKGSLTVSIDNITYNVISSIYIPASATSEVFISYLEDSITLFMSFTLPNMLDLMIAAVEQLTNEDVEFRKSMSLISQPVDRSIKKKLLQKLKTVDYHKLASRVNQDHLAEQDWHSSGQLMSISHIDDLSDLQLNPNLYFETTIDNSHMTITTKGKSLRYSNSQIKCWKFIQSRNLFTMDDVNTSFNHSRQFIESLVLEGLICVRLDDSYAH